MVELTIVESLLGAPPEYPDWRIADMAGRARLLPTWLSSMVARGRPISTAAHDYLDRMWRRVDILHRVGDELSSAFDVRVIKGAKIAARMPDGLLRFSGDADVVAPDETTLWRCVLDLRDRYGAVPQGVTVLQTDTAMDVVVAMKWPAEQPELDKPMGADISTCAFCGDLRAVPVRATPPEDDDLCSLFAVAEERFQRRFTRRDMLDLVVLADVLDRRFGADLPDLVAATAREQNLAPELAKLVRKTGEWVPLPATWERVAAALAPVVVDEKEHRGAGLTGPPRMRFGFPLDDTPSRTPAIQLREFAGSHLAGTPIGTCLLVDSPAIPAELHAAALAEVSLVNGR